jgi:hypothetical protein
MNKSTLSRKLAVISLLTTLLTQIFPVSAGIGTRNVDTVNHPSFAKKAGDAADTLSALPQSTPTPQLPKGHINPPAVNQGEVNKAVAFIPPQCDDKWRSKKLRIFQADKDLLAQSGIEISENNADFSSTNIKRCKAVASIDINEDAEPGSYRIRFHPDNAEGEMVEAMLEVTRKKVEQAAAAQDDEENGITVGKPKQFDERTLTLMLQGLESKLAQTQFPDTGGLYGNLGRFGGATANTSSMALSVRGPSLAATTTTIGSGTKDITNNNVLEEGSQTTTNNIGSNITNAGGVTTTVNSDGTITVTSGKTSNSSGGTGEVTSNNQQVINQAAMAPPVPALPGQTSLYPYQPQFGIAAQDLLAEQTSLFYQIVNLRMLLDRSLTDRIRVKPGTAGATDASRMPFMDAIRDQVVIGFQISINAAHKDAVAEAEITIDNEDVSLVSLLPQEKTYNVASVTKDSKAIDAGAVVQFIGVGGAMGKTQESMYLVKDTDTVALERKSIGKKVRFVWQFRPVLGRKTVEPGVRQVYALISVPNILGQDNGMWKGRVTAKTTWRKYDKKTKTVGDLVKGTNEVSQYDAEFPIGNPNLTDLGLQPAIESLSYEDAGNGQLLIVARGQGFTRDTNVILGNKVLSRPEDGLTIANERRLMLLATAQSLANNSPLMVSRYGTTEFKRNRSVCYPNQDKCIGVNAPYYGRSLEVRKVNARDSLNSEVTIRLSSSKEYLNDAGEKLPFIEDFDGYLFKHHPPVVLIGGRVFGFSDAPFMSKKYRDSNNPNVSLSGCADNKWCADLTFVAPTQLLANNTFLTFKEFLWDEGALTVDLPKQDNFIASSLTTLGSNGNKTQLAISGGGFTKEVVVYVGNTEFRVNCGASETTCQPLKLNLAPGETTGTFITLSPAAAQIQDVKHILITQGTAQPQTIALPSPTAKLPKAKIISPSPLFIPAGNSKRETLQGANLESIKEIFTLGGVEIPFELDEKDKTIIYLDIPKSITSPSGEMQIKLVLKDESVEFFTIVVK